MHIYTTSPLPLRRPGDLSLLAAGSSGGNIDCGRDKCAAEDSELAEPDGLMYPPSAGMSLGREDIPRESPAGRVILALAVRLVRCSNS